MTFPRLGIYSALALLCLWPLGCGEKKTTLQGSGATFPAPLYERWFRDYGRLHRDVKVYYEGTGSSAGKKELIEGRGAFAASDAAMDDKEIAEVKRGVLLVPATAGMIVLAYNVPGVGEGLMLSREVYAAIFLGEIETWDDNRIADLNPGMTLPSIPIYVVVRAEGSGTTYVYTRHLSAISKSWEKGPGFGTDVKWPIGDRLTKSKGNAGVAASIQQTPGTIGYIEYEYAKKSHLPTCVLENHAKKYIHATLEAGQKALANVPEAELRPPFRIWVSDPLGDDSYPIVTYTWILTYKHYDKPKVARALKDLLRYCLTDGQKLSADLGYIPLPEKVTKPVLEAIDKEITSDPETEPAS
jgi:phosphate transport system substrate-binding protein